MSELDSCPLCGALPCDWTNNPHETTIPDERAQSARIAALEDALRPFAGMRKSTEPEVSDLLNRSPSEQLRRQAELTERRDREIDNARLALGKGSE